MTMVQFFFAYFAITMTVLSVLVVTRRNPVHSVLWMLVLFVHIAGLYLFLNAEFLAAIQIIVYAGAIMVLFLFVIMMLNLGKFSVDQEKSWTSGRVMLVPAIMSAILLAQLINVLRNYEHSIDVVEVGVLEVSALLFGPYVLAVELASILLLAGLVSAYHLAKK